MTDSKLSFEQNIKDLKLSSEQKSSVRRSVKLSRRIGEKLRAALPNASESLISRVSIDLADLNEVAIKHRKFVKEISKLNTASRSKKLWNLFVPYVYVELLFHAQWHLKSLKKDYPRLERVLERASEPKKKSRK